MSTRRNETIVMPGTSGSLGLVGEPGEVQKSGPEPQVKL